MLFATNTKRPAGNTFQTLTTNTDIPVEPTCGSTSNTPQSATLPSLLPKAIRSPSFQCLAQSARLICCTLRDILEFRGWKAGWSFRLRVGMLPLVRSLLPHRPRTMGQWTTGTKLPRPLLRVKNEATVKRTHLHL